MGSKQDDNQEAVLTRAYSGSAQSSSPDFSPKTSEAFEVLKLEIQLFTLLPSASDSNSYGCSESQAGSHL